MQETFKQYLLLIRLPNVFTVPTNILVGYFSLTGLSDANLAHISLLMTSSSLLYVAGIVFNDFFDLKTDLKERPFRPLPSGKVSKRSALTLAIAMILIANVVALMVGTTSLMISATLSGVILAYNYAAKSGRFGPSVMGLARFLNVFLGASPALFATSELPWFTLFAASILFAYVYSITLLSRKEVDKYDEAHRKSILQSFYLLAGVALSTALFSAYYGTPEVLVFVILFSVVFYLPFRGILSKEAVHAPTIQNIVKNLVLSIIILDSVFIAAFAGLLYGAASLAIVVLPIILARKLYVT